MQTFPRHFILIVVLTIVSITSCAPAVPIAHGDSERKLTVGELERSYLLHVPPALDMTHPVPLVFVFHEHRYTASDMQELTGFNAISDEAGFIVVYPQGIGSSWNVGTTCCSTALTKNVDEVAFARAILADLETGMEIDPQRIYATGLSNGGALSYRFACEMSDTFAAVASVSGTQLFDPCRPAQPVSVMDVHGLKDDLAPYDGGGDLNTPPVEKLIHTWAGLDGCPDSPQVDQQEGITHTTYAPCKAGSSVELYTIEGVGNAWFTKDVMDTSRIVWDFFAAHPKQ